MKLTLYEQETTINYNNAEKTASIYTCDRALITKIEKLKKRDKNIVLDVEDPLSNTYIVPKSYIKIQIPKVLSEEQKKKLIENAKKNFGHK